MPRPKMPKKRPGTSADAFSRRSASSPKVEQPDSWSVSKTTDKDRRTQRQGPGLGLHVVATPIGNAGDITLRALDTLKSVDAILCEDTRETAKLLAIHGIARPLLAYHDHNADRVRPEIMAKLEAGASLALVSDAGTPLISDPGTPLISDPGYKLVREAIAKGVTVRTLPGASSVLAALTLAGLPTDRFYFAGFLPEKSEARRKAIDGIAAIDATLVLLESTRRLPEVLAELAKALGSRQVAVAREITKLFEETRRGSLDELAGHYAAAGPPKGEAVIIVGPPDKSADVVSDEALDIALRDALVGRSLADAVDQVAAGTGRRRRDVYTRALRLKDDA